MGHLFNVSFACPSDFFLLSYTIWGIIPAQSRFVQISNTKSCPSIFSQYLQERLLFLSFFYGFCGFLCPWSCDGVKSVSLHCLRNCHIHCQNCKLKENAFYKWNHVSINWNSCWNKATLNKTKFIKFIITTFIKQITAVATDQIFCAQTMYMQL